MGLRGKYFETCWEGQNWKKKTEKSRSRFKPFFPQWKKIVVIILNYELLTARITANEFLAWNGIDPLVQEKCRTYDVINKTPNLKNFESFYALFEHDNTDAHESHQTMSLNDVHKNLGKNNKQPRIV